MALGFSSGPGGGDIDNPSTAPMGGGGNGGLIGTLLQIGGMIYSASVARKNTKDQIAANKAQSEAAYAHDIDMWNRMNDYNDPKNQFARMMGSGINPNTLAGNASPGNAQTMPKYNAPTLQYDYAPVIDIPQTISAYQDFQMRQAQIDNVKAQTKSTQVKTETEPLRQMLLELQGKQGEFNYALDQETGAAQARQRHYQAQISENQADITRVGVAKEYRNLHNLELDTVRRNIQNNLSQKQLEGMDAVNAKRAADALFSEYKSQFLKMGVTTSDSIYVRYLAKTMMDSGLSPYTGPSLPTDDWNTDKTRRGLQIRQRKNVGGPTRHQLGWGNE